MKRLALVAALLAGCSKAPDPEKAKPVPRPAKILQFYASPGRIPKGDKTLLCYGTENVTELRLEPPVEKVWPAFTRCLEVRPAADTTYRLVAKGETEVSAEAKVTVGPDAPPERPSLIQLFSSSQNKTARGEPITLCYGVKGASRVTLNPGNRSLAPLARACLTMSLQETTVFTLEAKDEAGQSDSVSLRIAVN